MPEKRQDKHKETEEIVVDAEDAVLGRLASFVAKQARSGKKIVVVNSEKAKIIGDPKIIVQDYLARLRLGHGTQKGPIISRKPAALLRRAIRGMIGRKKTRGSEAFKNIKCYEGIPKEFEKKEKIKLERKEAIKFITLEKLSKQIGS
ncbi:MAG: 50S ribosomal protein L13 [Candidatus Pacearchaeota archaeon]|nr:50S ribosomal protein L13 [Candidatus Pacearchaeota archaeon]